MKTKLPFVLFAVAALAIPGCANNPFHGKVTAGGTLDPVTGKPVVNVGGELDFLKRHKVTGFAK